MKKLLVVIFFLTFMLAACEKEGTATPTPPWIKAWIDAPEDGATLNIHTTHAIQLHAGSYTGIAEFQLWIDGVMVLSTVPEMTGVGVYSSTNFFYEYLWMPTTEGTHTLRFVAVEASALASDETEIEVLVTYEVIEEGVDGPPPLAPTSTKDPNSPPRLPPPPTPTPARKILPTLTPTPGRASP